MVVTKKHLKADYDLEIDYSELMGDWSTLLEKGILRDDYMSSLMLTLHENYKTKKDYYPDKINIFKIFRDISLQDINIVIINCNPKFNKNSNGIAFGNKDNSNKDYDENLVELFENIEDHINGGMKVDKDYTLSNWTKQGVFLLNTALTGSSKRTDSLEWSRFIDYVIRYIDESITSTIFVFINDLDSYYSKKINDNKHIILDFPELNIDALEDINAEIECINGKDYIIIW